MSEFKAELLKRLNLSLEDVNKSLKSVGKYPSPYDLACNRRERNVLENIINWVENYNEFS